MTTYPISFLQFFKILGPGYLIGLICIVVGGIGSLKYLDHRISELSRYENLAPLSVVLGVWVLVKLTTFLPRRDRGLVIDDTGFAKLKVAGEYDVRWSEVVSVDPGKTPGGLPTIHVRLGPDSERKSVEIRPSFYGVDREEILETLLHYRRKAEEAGPRRPFWPVPGLNV